MLQDNLLKRGHTRVSCDLKEVHGPALLDIDGDEVYKSH